MLFTDLTKALVTLLRTRVQNGEFTERQLARLTGVSQPHIHNVLKGARTPSPALCDQLLQQLRLSVFDLVDNRGDRAEPDFPQAYD
jgi:transcriptional regulator with XRE-family HTH domain